MKFLIVNDESIVSGLTRIIYDLGNSLAKQNNSVYLVEGLYNNQVAFKTTQPGLKSYYYKPKINNLFIKFLTVNLGVLNKTRQIISRENISFDVVYGHLTLSSLGVFFFPKLSQALKIFHLHGIWPLEYISEKKSKNFRINYIKVFIMKFLQSLCLKKADLIIVCSNYTVKLASKYYHIPKEKFRVISPGIDTKHFCSIKNVRKIKKITKTKIFGTVGRLEHRKGIHNLLKAFKLLNDKKLIEDVLLLIIFPINSWNPQYNMLISMVNKFKLERKVQFLPNLNPDNMPFYYNLIDCLIMSSVELETFGLPIIESLSSGTLVLGVKVGAIPEILNKINSKLIVKKTNPKSIAEKILWFLSLKPEKRQLLEKKAMKTTIYKYNINKMEEKFIKVIKQNYAKKLVF